MTVIKNQLSTLTGKKTVAESVETEAVEALLREIGIDYTQGFLRHRPEPLDTILTMRSSPQPVNKP